MMRHAGNPAAFESNCGFDDARGYYTAITGDHLGYQYEVLGTLGRGSFGQVLRCQDHATGTVVAVKVIRNKKRFHTQALVELGILQHLRDKVRRLCRSISSALRLLQVCCKCIVLAHLHTSPGSGQSSQHREHAGLLYLPEPPVHHL